ncbi:MAG TPA: universal stress protein [Ktedonobacteraceae bacterium]|jgi:nucleotide-binding universal stress UspA family protein
MFKRILVPLDGSSQAERALPLAAHLAKSAHAAIILVRALNLMYETGTYMVHVANTYITNEEALSEAMGIRKYLNGVRRSALLSDIEVKTDAPFGLAADCILDTIKDERADLVVMNSHGYTGLKRWTLGSVAHKIARHSSVPVLILREESRQKVALDERAGKRVGALVALDGSAFAEASVIPAAQLVAALSAPSTGALHLVRVLKVPSPEVMMEYQRANIDANLEECANEEAKKYLSDVVARFAKDCAQLGVEVTWSVRRGRDVADTLVNVTELDSGAGPYDLIAMTTHGLGGLQRWIVGSVTEHVLTGTRVPVLVVRSKTS